MGTDISSVDQPTPQQMRTVIISSTLGTAIEWYDFFLYGTMATLVFPKLFFPSTDHTVGTLLSLLTFLVGFLARPFGGAIFGHMGDRVGRKSTLVATLMLMGVSTFIIGILPGYATLGIFAAILVTIMRLFQGLGVGGEWGGSVLLAMEYGHKNNRGFWASWPQLGAPLGLALSTIVVNIVQSSMGADAFLSWGWRIPFFVSALLIIVGLYIRLRVMETPLFAKVKEQNREASSPLGHAFRHSTPEILLSAGSRFIEQAPFYLFTTFVVTYGVDKLLLGKTMILNSIIAAAILEMCTIPVFGALSDRIGRRRWYLIGCVLMIAFAFPYYLLMNSGSSVLFVLAVILSLAFFHSWVYGPQAAMIAERFSTRSRYSGASLGYQLAAPLAGGLAPIIALLLLNGKTSLAAMGLSGVVVNIGAGSWQAVSIYIIILAIISFASVLGLKELTHADISSTEEDKVSPALVLAGED